MRHTASVAAALHGSYNNGHGKAGGHAPYYEADHGKQQANDENGFAAVGIGCATPCHGRDALRDGEGRRRDARPFTDLLLLDAEAAHHFWEVRVDRGVGERLGESCDGCAV